MPVNLEHFALQFTCKSWHRSRLSYTLWVNEVEIARVTDLKNVVTLSPETTSIPLTTTSMSKPAVPETKTEPNPVTGEEIYFMLLVGVVVFVVRRIRR